ncbi:MAG: glycosyltransferase family 9 protein [Planctomycetes bacterium]|nr:glycosyltransferase family 9 protein [Planctomycetota bacterium]
MAGKWVILHAGALGDLVLTVQLALGLDEVQRGRQLHLLARACPGDLSECMPSITFESLETLGAHWLYAEQGGALPPALLQRIHGRRVLNALGDTTSMTHRKLDRLEPVQLLSFDPRPRPGLRTHITRQWQRDVERQGILFPKCIHQKGGSRRLRVSPKLEAHGRRLLAEAGCAGPAVLIHPGSGGREKCWPLACFLDVGRQLRRGGRAVCFLVGPVELERWSAADIESIAREFPLVQAPPADTLACVLAAGRALVANDTGPAHLAALLGTPSVTVFGATSPHVWAPLGPQQAALGGDAEGRPDDWGIAPGAVVELTKQAAE